MLVNPSLVEADRRARTRHVEYRWPVGEPRKEDGETKQNFAVLSVWSFHPDRKHYVASLRNETEARREGSPFVSTSFGLFQSEKIDSLVAPRFSAKVLDEFADAALTKTIARFMEGDTAVTQYFSPAAVTA